MDHHLAQMFGTGPIESPLGRPVGAAEMSFDAFAVVAGAHLDPRQLALYAEVFRTYDEHGLPGNGLVLDTILGRNPRTLRDYVHDLAAGGAASVTSIRRM